MVAAGMVEAQMTEITSRIFIEASVETESGEAVVTIRDSHTNIVRIAVNGEVVFSGEEKRGDEAQAKPLIHAYTLEPVSYTHLSRFRCRRPGRSRPAPG